MSASVPQSKLPGTPAWSITIAQAALMALTIALTFRTTNHTHQWILIGLTAAAAIWAILRPDSQATTIWLILIGVWWLTGYNVPSSAAATQAALCICGVHYLSALLANAHRATKVHPSLLATTLVTLLGLCLATAAAAITIQLVMGSTVTSEQWIFAWSAASLIVLAAIATLVTQSQDPHRQRPTQGSQPATFSD